MSFTAVASLCSGPRIKANVGSVGMTPRKLTTLFFFTFPSYTQSEISPFYPGSSSFILFHPLLFSFILFHPLSSSYILYHLHGNNGQIMISSLRSKQPRTHEAGGKYGRGIIAKRYAMGQTIDIEVWKQGDMENVNICLLSDWHLGKPLGTLWVEALPDEWTQQTSHSRM